MSQFMNTIAVSIWWGMSPPATARATIPHPYLPVSTADRWSGTCWTHQRVPDHQSSRGGGIMAQTVAMQRHAPLQTTQLHTVINAYCFNKSHISVELKHTQISLFIYFLTLTLERNHNGCFAVTSWWFWRTRHEDVPFWLMLFLSNKKSRSLCLNKCTDFDILTLSGIEFHIFAPCIFMLFFV